MKFIVSQKQLNDAINVVQKAVSNKTTLPILKSIFLEAKDGQLRLIGNDLNIGIEMTIDAEVEIAGRAVVSSRIFGEIIRKLPDADVFISADDQHNLEIRCLQSDFHLAGFAPEEYPDLPIIEQGNVYEINKHLFKDMIRQTIFATSQDETRPILTGSLLEIENGEMIMVSIDLYRVAIRKANVQTHVDCKAVIPAKTLNELLKVLSLSEEDEDLKLHYTDKNMQFELGNITIITRLLEGEFIKYNQIMPKEHKSLVTVSTQELYRAIDRASLLAKEGKNTSVKFQITDEALLITSNVEIGSVNEMVKIELEGPDLEIGFNPKYWIDVLKVIDTDMIQIELTTNVSPCIVKPYGSEHYTYLVLPVRIPN
ncbi:MULTISPECIES: DNA polymerase III subunit beta [unclassified Fusibacter]|uniref:DNA polymerase III subunit beta n=1 Tax=unclassified Fusibacter TaxID=2624464 RepID=UPI0010123718|nr:DNA polymerase III subunit beta [Fusibacter sp. A1]MCK8060846.1 DNA polymerase III subunit beta [Fusibacter sp. A2]NPE23142.1 DNA polymerase III subunit beta [Fusibacter sp. A1]RXV59500.1 DNA polymerase III subunit beta [Fusibacter sp. A1]